MECEHFTDSLIYQMNQLTEYCKEQGEQYFKSINAGLTLEQFTVLDILSFNAGICQMDLAKIILKDRVFTSRIVNSLSEKGLIEKKVGTKGNRLVNGLHMTRQGTEIYVELKEEIDETFKSTFAEITDEEYEVTSKIIQKMRNCISKLIVMPL